MRPTIFGATGATGQQLVAQALAAAHEVVAFLRDPSRLTQQRARLTVVPGDLSDQAAVERAHKGASAVISVLGPRAEAQGQPITRGTQSIVAAMQMLGVRRLVVSSTPQRPRCERLARYPVQARRGRHPADGARRLRGHRAHRRRRPGLGS